MKTAAEMTVKEFEAWLIERRHNLIYFWQKYKKFRGVGSVMRRR